MLGQAAPNTRRLIHAALNDPRFGDENPFTGLDFVGVPPWAAPSLLLLVTP